MKTYRMVALQIQGWGPLLYISNKSSKSVYESASLLSVQYLDSMVSTPKDVIIICAH